MVSQTAVFTRLVRDHMGAAPPSVTTESSCTDVARLMREAKASSVIVSDAANVPVGIVTEQDICRRAAFEPARDLPVADVMSAPLLSIRDDEFLYHAVARMRRADLRHMPVVDTKARVVGILQLHDALTVAASHIVGHIDALTHEESLGGMAFTKAAQVEVATGLFDDSVPAPDVQSLLTRINNDLYRRIVALGVREMALDGWGEPPVAFDAIVMGSGGRGESYLNPDQDNGFVLADYPDELHRDVDPWFIELAERMTQALDQVGFSYCRGNVMATNPVWRKTISQWRSQIGRWVSSSAGLFLRMADIFFDFVPVYGDGSMTRDLRDYVARTAKQHFFLRQMYANDEEHGVALGFFGHIKTDPLPGEGQGEVNLKLTGTLPLVGAVRIMALRAGHNRDLDREANRRFARARRAFHRRAGLSVRRLHAHCRSAAETTACGLSGWGFRRQPRPARGVEHTGERHARRRLQGNSSFARTAADGAERRHFLMLGKSASA